MPLTPSQELDNAIYGLAGAVLTAMTVWIRGWIKEIGRQNSAIAVSDQASTYRALSELAATVQADRALVLYTHNGGGIPTVGKPLYVTILYEVFGGSNRYSIQNNFQKVLLDRSYIQVLSKVVEDKVWIGATHEISDGFLKALYHHEGVDTTMLFEIARTKNCYYFACLTWNDVKNMPSQEVLDLARIEFTSKISKALT